jgi:hypothetical protein
MPFVTSVRSAAQFLNTSEEFVRDLITSGDLRRSGRNSVTTRSLFSYRERDDAERRKASDELTRLGQEMDLP